jgi:hypothetical protein
VSYSIDENGDYIQIFNWWQTPLGKLVKEASTGADPIPPAAAKIYEWALRNAEPFDVSSGGVYFLFDSDDGLL